MFSSWSDFFGAVSDGCLDFGEFSQRISNFYYAITKTSDIESIWDAFSNAFLPIQALVTVIVLAACLGLAFFGQKVMPVLKFVVLFIVGFILGVYLIPPAIEGVIHIPTWICGMLLALVVAVLYKFLYIGLLSVAIAYSVYTVCYSGFYFSEITEISIPLVIICIIISISAVAVSLYFLRYIEMGLTAFLGAYFFLLAFRTMLLGGASASPALTVIIVLIISAPAVFVQYKMRKVY